MIHVIEVEKGLSDTVNSHSRYPSSSEANRELHSVNEEPPYRMTNAAISSRFHPTRRVRLERMTNPTRIG